MITSPSLDSMININPIHAFSDNFIWAITKNSRVSIVDPGDASVCIEYIEQHQLILDNILITHHHPDHVGGIKDLLDYCQQQQWQVTVFGPANEKIPYCDHKVTDQDTVNISSLGINFSIIDLPGHTSGHIAYYSDSASNSDSDSYHKPILFCGDTLFSGGCGRIFEGTPAQMLNSLTKLANLPDTTQVYCAHEYTQANLSFALAVEPNNEQLITYNQQVANLRAQAQATIPSSIKLEKQINPFLRAHIDQVQTSAQRFDSAINKTELEVFAAIRRWKDNF